MLFALIALVAYAQAQCSYDGIDFSPLINTATDYTGQDASSYYYRFNVCNNTVLTYSGSSCPTGFAAYQTGTPTATSPCYANCGAWSSATWSILDSPDIGYGLKYGNGRVCSGVPGSFLIKFVCGPTLTPPTTPYMSVGENGQCQYEVTFPTSLACVYSSSPSQSMKPGDESNDSVSLTKAQVTGVVVGVAAAVGMIAVASTRYYYVKKAASYDKV